MPSEKGRRRRSSDEEDDDADEGPWMAQARLNAKRWGKAYREEGCQEAATLGGEAAPRKKLGAHASTMKPKAPPTRRMRPNEESVEDEMVRARKGRRNPADAGGAFAPPPPSGGGEGAKKGKRQPKAAGTGQDPGKGKRKRTLQEEVRAKAA